MIIMVYSAGPYSIKCVRGDRHVNRYYFRQIPRATSISTAITFRMPNAPPQPILTDDFAVYAPRYLTYREIEKQVKSLDVFLFPF